MDIALAEWNGEFATVPVRQDGMVQFVGRKNIDFGHSEVMMDILMDILIFWIDEDVWMSCGVFAVFVDPRVQRSDVGVVDFSPGAAVWWSLTALVLPLKKVSLGCSGSIISKGSRDCCRS